MPARVAIRRLNLRGLAPRDHPVPGELQQRLADAAQKFLPGAIEQAVQPWSGDAVLRIRRLEVDITLDAAFDPRSFAAVLARAIVRELRRAEQTGSSDSGGVVCYASRAIYLAALLEALAGGRAADRWWLRDAEGLRFLSRSQAIRTAILAEPRGGLEALASLPPLRRISVLYALTPAEADRILDELARIDRGSASLEQCAEAVAAAAAELPDGASALAIFVAAFARKPVLAGAALVAAARLWVEIDYVPGDDAASRALSPAAQEHDATSSAPVSEAQRMRRILADTARQNPPARAEPAYRFTPFGGLLLLLPDLELENIVSIVATWPDAPADAAALVGHAALGLCAGRQRFAEYLGDGLWRELFGLDARASVSAMAARLAAIAPDRWAAFEPLLEPVKRRGDARFLLAPRSLVGSREAARALAGLARAASRRFARRLPGFRDASAPFLWTNLLATTAALGRRAGGWSARLSRPPLDVVLSLARVAEGSVDAPSGARVDFGRVPS
jgi:hypothetical protein